MGSSLSFALCWLHVVVAVDEVAGEGAPQPVHVVAVAEEDADPDLVALVHVEQQAVAARAARVEAAREDARHLVAVQHQHGLDGGVEARQDGRLEVVQAGQGARELACTGTSRHDDHDSHNK